jgi:hypothetical protein
MSDVVCQAPGGWDRIRSIPFGEQEKLELATLVIALMMIAAAVSMVFGWLAGVFTLLIPSALLLSALRCTTDACNRPSQVTTRREPEPELGALSTAFRTKIQGDVAQAWPPSATFELRQIPTRLLIRAYTRESAALAFVRDVVRLAGREEASQFELLVADRGSVVMHIAGGVELAERALEDRVL